MNRHSAIFLLALLCLASPTAARPDRVTVAVAANFHGTAQAAVDSFETISTHRVELVPGSTGKHYAQIVNGAPFDILLAADRARPERLEREGLAVSGSRFTYALGTLVLWSPKAGRIDDLGAVLAGGDFRHLALANPRLAPYGLAAQHTLERLGLWERLQPRMVFGENVGQAFRFVDSGAAELGFVALSQVRQAGDGRGSRWTVPTSHYPPIEQQAVLLKPSDPGRDFLEFLRSEAGRALILDAGYGVPDVH